MKQTRPCLAVVVQEVRWDVGLVVVVQAPASNFEGECVGDACVVATQADGGDRQARGRRVGRGRGRRYFFVGLRIPTLQMVQILWR